MPNPKPSDFKKASLAQKFAATLFGGKFLAPNCAYSPVGFANTTYISGTVGHFEHKLPALHQAAQSGDLNEVKRLLAEGTDIDGVSDDAYSKSTALMAAICTSQKIIAKYLINNDANLNIPDMYAQPFLHHSITRDDVDMVGYLLDHGARPDYKNNGNFTSLYYAIVRTSNYNYEGIFAILKCTRRC